ncbi:peptidase S28 [Hypoxylon fragiforme]|uniref:peptidase S28 n=1 Tax=Hypoxylon fragiforme TaxID=63214 RepID=UPI0020C73CD2|nr:peptidase S28 [Hypoxylon fragiforme]KAI2612986.1 peptidase S28 [Hypoxylon fragiforme]
MKSDWWRCIISLAAVLPIGIGALQTRQQDETTPRDQLQYAAHYFDQQINHFPDDEQFAKSNLSHGTFTQRYYYDTSYYKPGGPVYLYISGETSGPSRFSNLQTGIIQILMEATDGLGVILENRYYGESYPFNTSTTDELLFLTTNQTIADNAYFAQNAVFPDVEGDLTAPGTPWILYGGSLAGAQTALSVKVHGDVLYGGIASSAPIRVDVGYPEWYATIQKYAPQDCVARINGIVDNFDLLVSRNETEAIEEFKALFGLEVLEDHRDFAAAIADPIGNPGFYHSNTWQELNWDDTYGSRDFFYFCGNVSDIDAPEEISQADYVLANYTGGEPWVGLGSYANYVKKFTLPLCPSGDYNSNDCWGTQNASAWANIENTSTRSYLYTSCVEQGAYIAAPQTGPALLSRVIDTSYEQQWCAWAFAAGSSNAIPGSPNIDAYNSFGGFDLSADRLAFIDGDQDVWNDLCYHSDFAPAPRAQGTDLRPEYLITGAGHHWDSYGVLDVEKEPQFIREAHRWEVRVVRKWLRGFEAWKGGREEL